jgi:regulator of protease activity HflC (stomatin/prohibitin superfamily)
MMLTRNDRAPAPETDEPPKYRLQRSDKIIATLLFLGIASLFLWPFVFFVIRPGEVGVLYRLLTTGTETTFVYDEGLGVKLPWNRIYHYDLRTQARDETIHALAGDGLSIDIAITVLFHPAPEKVGRLHKEVGPDYVERLVRPLTIEAVRDVVGKIPPHDLYRVDVTALEQQVLRQLESGPGNLIVFQTVTVRDLRLPEALNQAITRKLTEQQYADAYEYILLQTQKEAERKRIEAIGIQTFYSIVANALSPQLLTWRGIEATVDIARSNNSKVVIVGGGKDQLPLILGSDIANQPDLPKPSAVDPTQYPLPRFEDLPRLFPNAVTPQNRQPTNRAIDTNWPPSPLPNQVRPPPPEGVRPPPPEGVRPPQLPMEVQTPPAATARSPLN